jgi:hypothetical protein
LILANFTYEPLKQLEVEVPMRSRVTAVKSLAQGSLPFKIAAPSLWRTEGYRHVVQFTLPLGEDDIVILETQ